MSANVLSNLDCIFNFFSWFRGACTELRLTWICSTLACFSVILAGVLPAVFITAETGSALHCNDGLRKLNRLLSFAVGTLLGDVFLHLLPETWQYAKNTTNTGLWVLAGLLICFIVEKFLVTSSEEQHRATALMNLTANFVDNFTHGLAVGGSFRVNLKVGILTTFAILVHEIPHEIGDFAILLRANFNRCSAIKAQLLTAVGGAVGATFALVTSPDSANDAAASWILPFTAGGFMSIALVQVLPELLKENDPRESFQQTGLILSGMCIMAVVNSFL